MSRPLGRSRSAFLLGFVSRFQRDQSRRGRPGQGDEYCLWFFRIEAVNRTEGRDLRGRPWVVPGNFVISSIDANGGIGFYPTSYTDFNNMPTWFATSLATRNKALTNCSSTSISPSYSAKLRLRCA